MQQLHPNCPSENHDVNNDIYPSILELCNVALLWVLKSDHCTLLNWMRVARSNHRGWRVFLVHLSLMTGQQSGWRGNRMGKFSTLLGLPWLRISPEKFPFFYFNAPVQSTDLFSDCWWHSTFCKCQQIEWLWEWQNYRMLLGSFITSLKRGRKQVCISLAFWDITLSYRVHSRQSDHISVSSQKLLSAI